MAAVGEAQRKNPEIMHRWVRVASRLGSMFPLIGHADGRTDLLLRALEDEAARSMDEVEGGSFYSLDLQIALSRYWVLSVYEALRVAKDSEAGKQDPRIANLHNDFALVRIPLAKHAIAKDKPAVQSGLKLYKTDHPDEVGPTYEPGKHIVPLYLEGATGSVAWTVIDIRQQRTVSISRRALSDALLQVFGGELEPSPT